MAQFSYAWVETVVRVTGRSVTVDDPYANDGEPTTTVEDLRVEVVNTADHNDRVEVIVDTGDRSIDATLTPDGRLQSLDYNSTGAGQRVVTGLAKVVAFVGSLVVSVARGGRPASEDAEGDENDETPAPDPWAQKHETEKRLREEYEKVSNDGAATLAGLRAQVLSTDDAAALRILAVRMAAVERVVAQARDELARIATLRSVWLDAQRQSRSSDIQTIVRFGDILPRTSADMSAPAAPTGQSPQARLWHDFGLILEAQSSSLARSEDDLASLVSGPFVRWRVPREVDLWVWKRSEEGTPTLVSRAPISVCDEQSTRRHMRLTSSVFGDHGASLAFNDDGQPSHLTHAQESAVGAAFDALGGVPDAVTGAAKQAKDVADALSALSDVQAERERTAADRELEIAKKRLELVGVHATEDDYAALQQAEQAVKLKTARASLAPSTPDELADLKRELETVQTRNAIAAEKRAAEFDLQLVELRSEIARLDLEVKRKQAQKELGSA